MKKIILSLVALSLAAAALAGGNSGIKNIPENILNKAMSDYPNAKMEKAEAKDEDGKLTYEFKLEQGEAEVEVSYDKDGKLIKSEQDIAVKDLPEAVRNAVSTNYPGREMKAAVKKVEDNSVSYEVKLKYALFFTKKVYFDESGREIPEKLK